MTLTETLTPRTPAKRHPRNHPCFGGCGKTVSGNKAFCLQCHEERTRPLVSTPEPVGWVLDADGARIGANVTRTMSRAEAAAKYPGANSHE